MTAQPHHVSALRRFLADHPRLVVITGAGVSLSSGIPTYRDQRGQWQHSNPITHQEFIADPARRRRYWARSLRGWPAVRDARPNGAHRALARMERLGQLSLLITQNVDRLHQRAGSTAVVDLHGRLDRVRCLACGHGVDRERVQRWLLQANPDLAIGAAPARPDGDAELAGEQVDELVIPGCEQCGGTLIPDVVFFGGSVPRERVTQCAAAIARADAVLAVGSSLQVFSGYRFCREARALGKALAIINPGLTRADAIASLKLEAECESLLQAVTG
jgi:NAD-dependent SIR2 family protein deacetylase